MNLLPDLLSHSNQSLHYLCFLLHCLQQLFFLYLVLPLDQFFFSLLMFQIMLTATCGIGFPESNLTLLLLPSFLKLFHVSFQDLRFCVYCHSVLFLLVFLLEQPRQPLQIPLKVVQLIFSPYRTRLNSIFLLRYHLQP